MSERANDETLNSSDMFYEGTAESNINHNFLRFFFKFHFAIFIERIKMIKRSEIKMLLTCNIYGFPVFCGENANKSSFKVEFQH